MIQPGTRVVVRCGHSAWSGVTGTVIEPQWDEPRPNKIHFNRDDDPYSIVVLDDDLVEAISNE